MAERPQRGGISFTGLLTILFIGLKLTNYIDWSWWWVLSPMWIVILISVTLVTIGGMVEARKKPWER